EVVQRPASVVKELVENAIDAGSTQIDIHIKDAGRTLIQVIDNGIGMSADDAVTAFLPHATSKIRQAEDLFNLSTMGFRGEALASIAAVAHVELRTKREQDELGSCVCLSGGTLESQELIGCSKGTNIAVRDLFYNIPARRKFLKSNESEFRNIVQVVEQITLAHPTLQFSLHHNGQVIYQLMPENTHKRILSLFGKKLDGKLLSVQVETILGTISGYVGAPEAAIKRGASQFFFVNKRYIQHPYFNKAIQMAYEKLIPSDARAPYFIYFDVEPAKIDVNIHPTKTEVRFEDEKAIFPILSAVVRETLGKSNSIPTIDFDQDDAPFIPALQTASLDKPQTPKVTFDPSYNPFKSSGYTSKKPSDHWEDLYQQKSSGFTFKAEEEPKTAVATSNSAWGIETELLPPTSAEYKVMQWKKKYVVVLTEAAIQVFHQHRLHARILFEQYLKRMQQAERYSMPLLFPEVLELSVQENSLFTQVSEDLTALGFEFEPFGKTAYQITSIPEGLGDNNPVQTVLDTMELLQTNPSASKTQQKEWMAQTLAEKSAIKAGKVLTEMEMKLMVEQLANCQDTTYAPNGKPLSVSLNENEIENKLI
ncbi:MAG: DNA mismatch repair endonuclease MutL, partial [Paludibacteraceae bacterium]|nr:DNA mismatch repair endonuclease MutL [Paludibacteraceae bacterium]